MSTIPSDFFENNLQARIRSFKNNSRSSNFGKPFVSRYTKRQLFIANTHSIWDAIKEIEYLILEKKSYQIFLFFDYRYERKEESITEKKPQKMGIQDIEREEIISRKNKSNGYSNDYSDDYDDEDDEYDVFKDHDKPYERKSELTDSDKVQHTFMRDNEMRRDKAEMEFFLYQKGLTRENIEDFLIDNLKLYKVTVTSGSVSGNKWSKSANMMKFNSKSTYYESKEHIYFQIRDLGKYENISVFQVNMNVIASY